MESDATARREATVLQASIESSARGDGLFLTEPATSPVPDPLFHDCGYAWAAHDSTRATGILPFGCPSEAEARELYGDEGGSR